MSNYPLRLPEHIMAEAKTLAATEARAARGNVEAALALLAKVPDQTPMEGDEIFVRY